MTFLSSAPIVAGREHLKKKLFYVVLVDVRGIYMNGLMMEEVLSDVVNAGNFTDLLKDEE